MAKNNSLSQDMQTLIDHAEFVAASASVLIKEKMKEDFQKAAEKSVDKYYEYKKGSYTKYGRKHNLYKIYSINASVSKKGDDITLSASILMDSDILEGLYHSNSQYHQEDGPWESYKGDYSGPDKDYGNVEADWVFKNFLSGKHPWTNGWPMSGKSKLKTGFKHSKPSPDKFLQKYLESYGEKYIDKYMQEIMINFMK